MINITNVKVTPVESNNRVVALATIEIDNCFVVKNIKVLEGKDGIFVGMPSIKNKDGSYFDVAHPINKETREYIQNVISNEYQKLS